MYDGYIRKADYHLPFELRGNVRRYALMTSYYE